MADKDTYLSNFAGVEKDLSSASPEWVHAIRRAAVDRFAEAGFPTPKHEEWRFTRVRPLLQQDFRPATGYKSNGLTTARLESLSFAGAMERRLVFVNGHYADDLSHPGSLDKGVKIGSLRLAFETDSGLIQEHLGKYADADTAANPFVALNTMHVLDGAFVYVPKGVTVEEPIHLIFASTEEGVASYPRNLVIAEDGARATVVESYVAAGADVYFTSPVTEIVVGATTDVDHYKLQKESESAYHIATIQTHIGREARMNTNSLSLGGALVRNDIVTTLGGEGIECTIDGLYLADRHQHVDHHTRIEHAEPHCNSYELYKGILNGRAKAVFNGKIHVHPDAQKTDAKQSNRCILLSDDAQVNSNPQLEIYADDVKCTHGAAVGQIDEDAVFYLRSRGVSQADARHMLVYAFANEVLDRVRVTPLRERLATDLFDWLSRAQPTTGA